MSIRADHFVEFVVVPTLDHLARETGNNRINSPAAVQLILGTFAHESHLCEYLRQHPAGPARGGLQMELETYDDLWANYLKHRAPLADAVRSMASPRSIVSGIPEFDELIGNLNFAVAMARVRYLPAPQILPVEGDIQALAEYHVRWYNRGGSASAHKFVSDYSLYVSKTINAAGAGGPHD